MSTIQQTRQQASDTSLGDEFTVRRTVRRIDEPSTETALCFYVQATLDADDGTGEVLTFDKVSIDPRFPLEPAQHEAVLADIAEQSRRVQAIEARDGATSQHAAEARRELDELPRPTYWVMVLREATSRRADGTVVGFSSVTGPAQTGGLDTLEQAEARARELASSEGEALLG